MAQGGWVQVTDTASAVSHYTTSMGYVGASMVDLDGDGYVDLYAAPRTLFRNDGTGRFATLPSLSFTPQQGASGASWADLDNDGDNDVVVASYPSKVLFNNAGTFADSSPQVPGFTAYASWAAAIGDYNGDRELDFIFAHANGFHPGTPAPCRLYIQGQPVFSPWADTSYSFTTQLAPYTVPYWSDYDLDGDMDLFIASGPATGTADFDPCFKNLKVETGMDTLVQMTTELFAMQTQDGQCYNFVDYDNDGDLDLCLTNYIGATTRLYRNDMGVYTTVATPFSTTSPNLANCWGDYDNDGDQDVIIANGNVAARYYRNNGNATFTYLPNGFSTPTAVCCIANGDVDNDGDLDLFVNGIGNNGSGTSVGLYLNDTVAGNRNFVNLSLVGVASNRSAIGATVRVKATINGSPVWQLREVNAQNTFQGQNDLRVHVGLGNAAVVDSLVVTWPSGAVDVHVNALANAFYQVTEGMGIATHARPAHWEGMDWEVFPNPVHDLLTIACPGQGEALTYRILDARGRWMAGGALDGAIHVVPVQGWPAGVYLVQVVGQTTHVATRVVKW